MEKKRLIIQQQFKSRKKQISFCENDFIIPTGRVSPSVSFFPAFNNPQNTLLLNFEEWERFEFTSFSLSQKIMDQEDGVDPIIYRISFSSPSSNSLVTLKLKEKYINKNELE